MSVRSGLLPNAVRDRFPDDLALLQFLVATDPAFRELCSNYVECREALHRWRQGRVVEVRRVRDYQLLSSELEAELDDFLRRSREATPWPGDTRA
jgi:hypothetical protein